MQGRSDTRALHSPYNSQGSLSQSAPSTSSVLFTMAITHADLSHRRHWFRSSKVAHSLVIFSVICGLFSFILCLTAEAARSEVSWMIINRASDDKSDMCTYSGSGKTALLCAVAALVLLGVAMFTEHANMLVTVTSPRPPATVAWTAPETPLASRSSKAFTLQACTLVIATWPPEQLTRPRASCPAVRPGMFAAAGIFGLVTIFLGVGLYLTALLSQRLDQQEENIDPSEYIHHQGFAHGTPGAP
ncbi:hypothetical protein J5N97_014054 [Dioscorea zingiberensis]|uniref:Uncharacterized protein n=1 Tax=Dioscorea zingiberensis TaxID=325984 RepID=A0A9D5CUI1_9LILI|nr:hypothetical protein J5N97_014054 [Dioscorea zingiberensis]